jgi:gliding motility-associated-like protein
MRPGLQWYITICLLLSGMIPGVAQISFTENRGQWPDHVYYRANVKSGAVFLEESGLSFLVLESPSHPLSEKEDFSGHAEALLQTHFQLKFLNTNPDLKITGDDKSTSYSNFILGNDPEKWASNCYDFSHIKYEEIYEGIDLLILSAGDQIKYEFHVAPNVSPDLIEMEVSGSVSAKLREGELVFETSLGEIIDHAPIAFQEGPAGKKDVSCRYKLKGKKISFKLNRKYERDLPLIIDPYLVFSTYTGSYGDNWGFTATFDEFGNVFSGGIVWGTSYPVSSNAADTSFNTSGLWDIGIIKFDSSGTQKLWATYLGGEGGEMPHSMVAASNNDLFIMGTTGSSDFPMHPFGYDTTFAGGTSVNYLSNSLSAGTDMFVVRLAAAGTYILGSTFLGGTENDGLNFRPGYSQYGSSSLYYNYGDGARGEIMVDQFDFVYVGSTTFSDNYPTAGSPVQTISYGEQEGVISKLNPYLTSLDYSTYFGSDGDDAIYSIDIDLAGNIYVAGGTTSDTLQYSLSDLPNDSMGGQASGFVAKINPSGSTPLATCMFGTELYDQVFFVKVNDQDSVYIAGTTKALNNELIVNADYANNNGGQFIAQLNTNLDDIIWSTQFGVDNGKPDLSLTAFSIGLNHNLYISGWGIEAISASPIIWAQIQGIKDMDITETAVQPTSDGADFYVMVISDDGNCLNYATFFGEQHYSQCNPSGRDHVDGGTSRFDKRGFMYQAVCASCGKCNHFPTYPANAYSLTNNSNNCNNAVFKFEMVTPKQLPDLHFCKNADNALGPIDPVPDITYNWTPNNLVVDPSNPNTQIAQNIDTLLMLYMYSGGCVDSILQRISFHSIEYDLIDEVEMCEYETRVFGPDPLNGNAFVQWSTSADFSTTYATSTDIEVDTDSSQYYYFRTYNDFCEYIDSVKVTVHNVMLHAEPTYVLCSGDTTELHLVNQYPEQNIIYNWTPAELILSGEGTANPAVSITSPTDFYIYSENDYGCVDQDTITLLVSEFSEWAGEVIPLEYDTVFFSLSTSIVTAVPHTVSYAWEPNYFLSNTNSWTVVASPLEDTLYYVTVADQFGCYLEDSIYIYVEEVLCDEVHVFIPSAFTPNGDNQNDQLRVYSRMTSDISLFVYNRWGEVVFETTDITKGWDGTYRGEALPPGVFVYHLKAVCWDGSTYEKKGNVTLLK